MTGRNWQVTVVHKTYITRERWSWNADEVSPDEARSEALRDALKLSKRRGIVYVLLQSPDKSVSRVFAAGSEVDQVQERMF